MCTTRNARQVAKSDRANQSKMSSADENNIIDAIYGHSKLAIRVYTLCVCACVCVCVCVCAA